MRGKLLYYSNLWVGFVMDRASMLLGYLRPCGGTEHWKCMNISYGIVGTVCHQGADADVLMLVALQASNGEEALYHFVDDQQEPWWFWCCQFGES